MIKLLSNTLPVFLLGALFVCLGVLETAAQSRRGEAAQPLKVQLNVKRGRGKIDRNLGKPARTRGTTDRVCTMEIVNRTPFRIQIYVNERYRETLTARQTTRIPESAGRLKIYSRTERDTRNRFNYWGPGYYTCGDNERDGSIFLIINNKNF